MTASSNETASLRTEQDVVVARQIVRRLAQEIGFSLVEQTKIVTATSELARNTVRHGRGGVMSCEVVRAEERRGLRLTFIDEGPGIPDIGRAMTDGYSTAGGLGMGLSGARRLVSEFDIESAPGKGTRVTVVRWR